MKFLRDLEAKIDSQLRTLFASKDEAGRGQELIEIQRSILDDALQHVETLPRGRRVFPYDEVKVHLLAAEAGRRAAFEIVFLDGDGLRNTLLRFLREEGCEVESDLNVQITFIEESVPDLLQKGFHIHYSRRDRVRPPAQSKTVRLTVLHGEVEKAEWLFDKTRINVGRLPEVLDGNRRLARRNDLYFSDSGEPPNSTVSRGHAHLHYHQETGEFRVVDEQSAYGTTVSHDGRLIQVAPGSGRGVRIMPGDEIYFGQARVRFEVD